MEPHWLVRPGTIRVLWGIFIAALALAVLAGFLVGHRDHAGLEATFGFAAWYGFGACAVLIAGAKLLGVFLKRSDTYYDRDARDD